MAVPVLLKVRDPLTVVPGAWAAVGSPVGAVTSVVGASPVTVAWPVAVVALLAEPGAKLEKGAPILTLEVMKMEQTLRAPFAGVLKVIKCKVGDIVQEGVELAEIEPEAK